MYIYIYIHYYYRKQDRHLFNSSPRGHGHGRPLWGRRGPAFGAPGAEAALQDHVDGYIDIHIRTYIH